MDHTYTTITMTDRRGVVWTRRLHDQYPYVANSLWESDRGERKADHDVNDFGPFVGVGVIKTNR